jgi:hypothetical protein
MKTRFTLVVLSLLVLLVAGLAVAQDQKTQAQGQGQGMGMSPEDMAAMEKAGTPGAEHKRLAAGAGHWTYTMTMWMAPGAQPMEATGTMDASTLLGGRYLESTFKGSMMGMPFEGHALDGYDNVKREYFSTWVDNMSTGLMMSTGKCSDPDCKVMSMSSEMPDPATGKPTKFREVTTHIDKDNSKFEMFVDPGQGEFKTMEMLLKRKG